MEGRAVQGYNKAFLRDIRNKHDITAEINFSEDEGLKDCVKMTMGKNTAIIPIKELYTLVWSVVDTKQRTDLTPITQTLVRKIKKRHIVEVTRDIKKGEKLNVRCEVDVPVEMYEGLQGMMPKRNHTTEGVPIIGAK